MEMLPVILALAGMDLMSFAVGVYVGTSVRTMMIAKTVIRLQGDIIGLNGENRRLNEVLTAMKAEIAELRDQISKSEAAYRHLRNNLVQARILEEEIRVRGAALR